MPRPMPRQSRRAIRISARRDVARLSPRGSPFRIADSQTNISTAETVSAWVHLALALVRLLRTLLPRTLPERFEEPPQIALRMARRVGRRVVWPDQRSTARRNDCSHPPHPSRKTQMRNIHGLRETRAGSILRYKCRTGVQCAAPMRSLYSVLPLSGWIGAKVHGRQQRLKSHWASPGLGAMRG